MAMNYHRLKDRVKGIIPLSVKKVRRRLFPNLANPDSKLGLQFLSYAREFSKHIGGKPEAFERSLDRLIKTGNFECNDVYLDLLDAFLPGYEGDLYRYYTYQQFLILFRFLQYPFLNPGMAEYTIPYQRGISALEQLDVVDYGSGIPYGLIECLATKAKSIRSATLIDLDLIHVDFVEFVIGRIAPGFHLTLHRLRDPEEFPSLTGPYNFFFGKDIFEHLHRPDEKLRQLMQYSAKTSFCYFDFNDKGTVIYQHVTPGIGYLTQIMNELGFETRSNIHNLLEFAKSPQELISKSRIVS